MYYIMDSDLVILENGSVALTINNYFKLAGIRLWLSGKPIKLSRKQNIPNPVEIDFDPHHGYKEDPGELVASGITMMSQKLTNILVAWT